MAEIHVSREQDDRYRVEVRDGGARTEHTVTVSADEASRFGGAGAPERLVEESFRFLLEREPATSILRRFALSVIADYFPEYPEEIVRRLSA